MSANFITPALHYHANQPENPPPRLYSQKFMTFWRNSEGGVGRFQQISTTPGPNIATVNLWQLCLGLWKEGTTWAWSGEVKYLKFALLLLLPPNMNNWYLPFFSLLLPEKKRLRLEFKNVKFALPDQKWTIPFLRTFVSFFSFSLESRPSISDSIIVFLTHKKIYQQIQILSKGDFKAWKYLRLASGAKMHILATFSEKTFYLLYILSLFWDEPTVANGLGE